MFLLAVLTGALFVPLTILFTVKCIKHLYENHDEGIPIFHKIRVLKAILPLNPVINIDKVAEALKDEI